MRQKVSRRFAGCRYSCTLHYQRKYKLHRRFAQPHRTCSVTRYHTSRRLQRIQQQSPFFLFSQKLPASRSNKLQCSRKPYGKTGLSMPRRDTCCRKPQRSLREHTPMYPFLISLLHCVSTSQRHSPGTRYARIRTGLHQAGPLFSYALTPRIMPVYSVHIFTFCRPKR
ncbi:Uncharacterised protein [uncultured archaeon]|nr:Uncharacterised protein [uncultured archaeon]